MRSSASEAPRIGIVTTDFPPVKGGAGRVMQWMVETLRSRGMVIEVPSRIRRSSASLLLVSAGPGNILLLRRPKHARILQVMHHTYLQQARAVPGQRWKSLVVPLERRACRMAEAICCFSPEVREVLVTAYGIPPERVALLPQAIAAPAEVPASSKEEGLCVCVARLQKRKGVEVLLRAWERVRHAAPRARLVLVGEGILRRRVDRAIARLGPCVRRIARLSDADLRDLLRRSELAICPSFLEGFGRAAAEAMAAGAAVIASDAEGLRSLIAHRETGLLVPSGNPDALAEGILQLLGDAPMRQGLAEAGRRRVLRDFHPALAEEALLRWVERFL
jgi:glycosyltransferase involved in cell wall biosynthesis